MLHILLCTFAEKTTRARFCDLQKNNARRMKKEITARALLTLIREQSFANATPSDVLRKSIVELAEMAIASYGYLDGIGWLIGQFWEDRERKIPCEDEPLMDEDGELWSREDMGDELTDEEYLVAEKIYHTAEFCSALYHHHPFDLRVLGENCTADPTQLNSTAETSQLNCTAEPPLCTTGSFEYANTALMEWIQRAEHRRVAALVCRIVLDEELDKAMRDNQAVQDYYAERVYGYGSYNWQQVDVCEQFIQRAMKGMGEIARHYEEARQWGLEGEAVQVLDLLYGWVPHLFEEEMIATAREILDAANRLLPDELTLRNDSGARAYINLIFKEAQQIAAKYEVDLDINDGYSLTIGYMNTWLERKYWGDRGKEEEW